MHNRVKTLFFLSAFSPSLLTLALVNIGQPNEFLNALICIAIVVLSIWLTKRTITAIHSSSEKYKISLKKLKSTDLYMLKYIASYLLPIILKGAGLDLKLIGITIAILALALYFLTTIDAHPILSMLGYRFYEVHSDSGKVYVMIAKRKIRAVNGVNNVSRITEDFLVEEQIAKQ